MDIVSILATGLGSAWLSGLNLYATVAMLGLLGRFGGLQLPGGLDVLTNKEVIAVALALYTIEFFADKIPYLDSAWDVLHTFIRIPAGAVLAAGAFGHYNKEIQVLALLAGGTLAFTSHGAKAAARAAINLSPEPVTNWIASVTEDAIAIGGTLLAVYAPVIMLILLAVAVVAVIVIAPKLIRGVLRIMRAFRKIRSKLWPPTNNSVPPGVNNEMA